MVAVTSAAPSRTADCTASSSPARRGRPDAGSASSTRRWSSSCAPGCTATSSSSGPAPGGSRRSRRTASWWSPPPGSREAPLLEGRTVGRPSSGPRAGRLRSRGGGRPCARGEGPGAAVARLGERHDLDPRAAANLVAYLGDEARRPGRFPRIARSWWSGFSTRWATGVSCF